MAAGLRLPAGRWAAGLLVAVVVATGACAGSGAGNGGADASQTSGPSGATAAVAQTRAAIAQALGQRSLQLADAKVPYRPPEPPVIAAAPRSIYQVVLPADPNHGFIAVYEFPDAAAAAAAGHDLASYVGSGPGRVEFQLDARFVIRQLGTTLVFYDWSPANSPDPRTAEIQPALETVGTPIEVPR
ncbi:MAG TPA: hypothetical protein VGC90_06760 [Candidatus Limnocylindrales bacterium]